MEESRGRPLNVQPIKTGERVQRTPSPCIMTEEERQVYMKSEDFKKYRTIGGSSTEEKKAGNL